MEANSVKNTGTAVQVSNCTISQKTANLIACYEKADKLFNEIREAYVLVWGDPCVAFSGEGYSDDVEKKLEGYEALNHINEARYALVRDIGSNIQDNLLNEGGRIL